MNRKQTLRILQLVATGGLVFQVAGCAGGLAPVFLSLAESVVLELLLGPFVPVL